MRIEPNQWYTFLGPDADKARDEFLWKVITIQGYVVDLDQFKRANPDYAKAQALKFSIDPVKINYRTTYKPEYQDLENAIEYQCDENTLNKENNMNNKYTVFNLVDDYEQRETNRIRSEFNKAIENIMEDLPVTKAAKKYIKELEKLGVPVPVLNNMIPSPEIFIDKSKIAATEKNNMLIALDNLRSRCQEARALLELVQDIYDARMVLRAYGICADNVILDTNITLD